ncbi:Putative survival protein SurE-like phosphatase/nucleotidase [Colletotrichum destructivum]|uniref:Survival protein SurE-like phosphatase/nucleotidase n=1 Tax=Colletotrichum destructivum TaxID=34406 RepID=A0AAX4J3V7_9PEZI|nr:Putative survival protein SurE-like phosphatase/nucleotidase [Colletotrichum destructivum]
MHILVTNDDGPPSPNSSPYIRSLVHYLQKAGHVVSVCLPHTQRSWIGKAHMIGKIVETSSYYPSADLHATEDTASSELSLVSADEWTLIDGTPASCVQIGLYHFFQGRGPIDIVVSGPNYGGNTTAVFGLSSGTLGAALEAAMCKRKAIAISFASSSQNHNPEVIDGAARHSVKVIEKLYHSWPLGDEVDLYSVNVPLVEGIENHKTLYTGIFQNYWGDGSSFQEVHGEICNEDNEKKVGEGVNEELCSGNEKYNQVAGSRGHLNRYFKWMPRLADVHRQVEEAAPGNDAWTVQEGYTSTDINVFTA